MPAASPTAGSGIHPTMCRADARPPLSRRSQLYQPAPRPFCASHGHTVSGRASIDIARTMRTREPDTPSNQSCAVLGEAISSIVAPDRMDRRVHITTLANEPTAAPIPIPVQRMSLPSRCARESAAVAEPDGCQASCSASRLISSSILRLIVKLITSSGKRPNIRRLFQSGPWS